MDHYDYLRDGQLIYQQSFATIRRESALAGLPREIEACVVRMIHASGMTDIVTDLAYSPGAGAAARRALAAGATIFCDSEMVAHGITRARLPAANPVVCTLRDPAVPGLAAELGNTRSAAALTLWGASLAGAVVAIGNAPTALFHLLNRIAAGGPKPAVIVGMPVGFIGAVESKQALAEHGDIDFITLHGRRGGSAMAAAAVNALATEREI